MGGRLSELVFRAIADPTRRAMLARLRDGELPAAALWDRRCTRSSASQHLRVLREAGLVSERRRGRQRLYSLQAGPLLEVGTWVQAFAPFWDGVLDRLEDVLDEAGDR
jgi:DNA-binding transcriptional ArsR family regulator